MVREMEPQGDNDVPKMFRLGQKQKRLLHRHQYQVLWKQAASRLTEQLESRYPSLVSMFRAFDEDKDGKALVTDLSTVPYTTSFHFTRLFVLLSMFVWQALSLLKSLKVD